MNLNSEEIQDFKSRVWDFYKINSRNMPWRLDTHIYNVWISEIMLQQTQVNRVVPKFESFIRRFPNVKTIAEASLNEVLDEWIGLGYNRRAKFIKMAADYVAKNYNYEFPESFEELLKLPGIGKNTAAAILVYSTNKPYVFVETNIRTVFIHCFLNENKQVDDDDIIRLVQLTMDNDNPREWFWALMDYGTWIKKEYGNLSRKSSNYSKQSKFEGSFRQKRARILKEIVKKSVMSFDEILFVTGYNSDIVEDVVQKLQIEGFIQKDLNNYFVV